MRGTAFWSAPCQSGGGPQSVREGRARVDGEGCSIYFHDYDNHLFELRDRLAAIPSGVAFGNAPEAAKVVTSRYSFRLLTAQRTSGSLRPRTLTDKKLRGKLGKPLLYPCQR